MIGFDETSLPMLTLVTRIGLLLMSMWVVNLAIRAHMPWSMVTALLAGVGMALTLILAGLKPAGLIADGDMIRPFTFILSFASTMLLMASIWTFNSRREHWGT